MAKTIFKNDKYKKKRGGYSRLLDISCAKCRTHLFYYQKDGPGMLKRVYLDRMYGSKKYSDLQNLSLKSVPTLGDFVTIAWKKYEPRFAEARKSDQYLGEYFQWLAERMDEYSKSAPREPFYMTKEKTIRRRAS